MTVEARWSDVRMADEVYRLMSYGSSASEAIIWLAGRHGWTVEEVQSAWEDHPYVQRGDLT